MVKLTPPQEVARMLARLMELARAERRPSVREAYHAAVPRLDALLYWLNGKDPATGTLALPRAERPAPPIKPPLGRPTAASLPHIVQAKRPRPRAHPPRTVKPADC